ncbi:hypothetical protein HMPREF9630_00546 [Peptoanaerobacter stomatis]|uniref:Uncharacterized protein n=1 Tax=Peptoanaerobacter stomatis TaxID=796937 RepID=V9HPY6_9FIRM|nr:pyocin knob domain-containing protein [Peptoanaerobacter stomatis]EHL17379.1 hypothetical protein HMPREF9630_00546 [Peptoanaerobacter stomatis]
MIEITKFKPSDRASAEVFNKRLEEIETYLKNVVEENQQLRQQLNNKVEVFSFNSVSIDVLNNFAYPNNYETDTNLGIQLGLQVNWVRIKYFKHSNAVGYGTQIAIPFEGGYFSTMYIRNSTGNAWGAWNDMRSVEPANKNTIVDANVALENGKIYYCSYQQTANLPYSDDGILHVFSPGNVTGNETVCFQMWYSWNMDCVCYRKCVWGSWSPWKRIATTNI